MKRTALGVVLVAPLLALGSGAAQASSVTTYSGFADGNGLPLLFDAVATETGAAAGGNSLTIVVNNFKADGASSATYSALDTLAFNITAPDGYVITKIKYIEGGEGAANGGVALATGSINVAGTPYNFLTQLFQANDSGAWTIQAHSLAGIDVPSLAVVPVSIVNSLFAVGGTTATIQKINATLDVTVAAIPLPPAVWLLGSALFGVGVLGRRNTKLAA